MWRSCSINHAQSQHGYIAPTPSCCLIPHPWSSPPYQQCPSCQQHRHSTAQTLLHRLLALCEQEHTQGRCRKPLEAPQLPWVSQTMEGDLTKRIFQASRSLSGPYKDNKVTSTPSGPLPCSCHTQGLMVPIAACTWGFVLWKYNNWQGQKCTQEPTQPSKSEAASRD